MLYSVTKQLSHETINKYVSDYDIYSYYWGIQFEINKIYNSPLRVDNNPSFGIISNSDGVLVWNDLATGDKGNAITFVKSILQLNTYKDALYRIYKDLIICNGRIPTDNQSTLKSSKNGQRIEIGVKRKKLSKIDIDYWQQYGISTNTLKLFEVDPIQYLFIGDYIHWIYEDTNPMYAYKVYDKYKIYRPLSNKKEKWHGNLTKNYVFGYKQLPKTGDLLIITKSLKDVMLLYELGYTSISPCSEGTLLPTKVIDDIKVRFKNIIVLFDNDEAGIKSAERTKEKYNFKTVLIPKESGEKDLTDYYTKYGKVDTSILLESLFYEKEKE